MRKPKHYALTFGNGEFFLYHNNRYTTSTTDLTIFIGLSAAKEAKRNVEFAIGRACEIVPASEEKNVKA